MTSGTHDLWLVATSILIAVAASYTALDLASRISAATSRSASAGWLAASAFAMGGGIWSMHFVAMLAFSMPGMEASYDVGLTVLSFALAVGVTGIGFYVVSRSANRSPALVASGVLMGAGIAGMHYTGMAAMRMPVTLNYSAIWVSISVFIAIGAAVAALWLAFARTGFVEKALASLFMGAAVAGMHYAGMQAATYTLHHAVDPVAGETSVTQIGLALAVSTTTFFILGLALVASIFDRRFALLAENEAALLRKSEERFRNLYRKTPLPLFSMNPRGELTDLSDACLSLLGGDHGMLIGRQLDSFMLPGSSERWRDDFERLIAQGSLDGEYQFNATNSGTIDVVASARLEPSESGALSVLGGLVDVTARNRTEAALRQAQKMESLGQMTGGVAHDFNNLLAVIIGSAEMLRKRVGDDPKLLRPIEATYEAGRRGAMLTQRMLSFARQQHLNPASVDVKELIAGITDLLQRSVGPLFEIRTRLADGPIIAHADAHQLEMSLLNLVVNARDATGESGVIEIEAAVRSVAGDGKTQVAAGDYAVISVIDHGAGMDAETLSRAREPFFTTKGVAKGTGLGLSMVHGFAEQSSGRLEIRSAPGAGTVVDLWLPAALAPMSIAATADATSLPAGGALHVLCVDDDPLVLMNTMELLEELGHRPTAASSGDEALKLLSQGGGFDAVLTDQAMPGMTGVELAERILRLHPTMRIIIATGYDHMRSGSPFSLPVLRKPFMQDELARALTPEAA